MSLRFQNTQEVGDNSEWDSVFTNGPRITVTAGGLNGSSYKITGQTTTLQPNRFEMDMSLLSSLGTTWRFGWRLEPNSISYGTATRMIFSSLGPSLFRFYIKESGSDHVLEVDATHDDLTVTTITGTTIFSNADEITVEIKITQAASSVSSDGTYEIFLNGISEGTATGIDNFDRFNNAKSDEFEVDAPNMTGESGFSGDIFLDDVTFRDDNTVIFPLPVVHLKKSTDGGSNFTDIGDSATWGTGTVSAFIADDASTLFAFVDGGSRALYRSVDAGANWTNLSTLPFDVEAGGVSKHPDGRILISNRDAGAQTAAYAEAPDYSSWIDATGNPSFPATTPGNGSNAIIWIV
jgi:hypothetical protein